MPGWTHRPDGTYRPLTTTDDGLPWQVLSRSCSQQPGHLFSEVSYGPPPSLAVVDAGAYSTAGVLVGEYGVTTDGGGPEVNLNLMVHVVDVNNYVRGYLDLVGGGSEGAYTNNIVLRAQRVEQGYVMPYVTSSSVNPTNLGAGDYRLEATLSGTSVSFRVRSTSGQASQPATVEVPAGLRTGRHGFGSQAGFSGYQPYGWRSLTWTPDKTGAYSTMMP